jgi:transposase InsO family protein
VEVVSCIEQYEAAATARFSVLICKFRCDNGGEYVTNELKDFFAEKGIQFECTIPYSPALNGVSERMNRVMLDKARSMLIW